MTPQELEVLIARTSGPIAFDADGTLWPGDVGEALLRDYSAPLYAEYEQRVAKDPCEAYAWTALVMAGESEAALESRSRRVFSHFTPFGWTRVLAKCEAWIVSASPMWIVRVAAQSLGVPPKRVIAVEHARRPIPCREGKVACLSALGVRPALALGNGELDLPMLAYARAAVVVAPKEGPDNPLLQAAKARAWPVLRY